ncbi:hypothetical protein GCM10009602_19390 [Nocardiopsis tropica]
MPGETPACRATSVMPTEGRVDRGLVDKELLPGRVRTVIRGLRERMLLIRPDARGIMLTPGLKRVNNHPVTGPSRASAPGVGRRPPGGRYQGDTWQFHGDPLDGGVCST